MSMFSQIKNEPTCTTVDECVQSDRLSNDLWTWAHRLEKLGMALFVLLLVYGIYAAAQGAMVEEVHSWGVETEFDFMAFLVGLIDWAFYAFIEYCLYHVVALLIGALAGIYQNTKAAARLQEYQTRKGEGVPAAGVRKAEGTLAAGEKSSPEAKEDGRVTCPKCGTPQHAVREKCYNCGTPLPRE